LIVFGPLKRVHISRREFGIHHGLKRLRTKWAPIELHRELLVDRLDVGQLHRRSANCAGLAGVHVGNFFCSAAVVGCGTVNLSVPDVGQYRSHSASISKKPSFFQWGGVSARRSGARGSAYRMALPLLLGAKIAVDGVWSHLHRPACICCWVLLR
jgi:hypothetical protein